MSSGKTYIIYFEWSNTASNHAGMAYLVRELKRMNMKKIRLIRIPPHISNWNKYIQKIYAYLLVYFLSFITKANDNILFVEYLGNRSGNQTEMAQKLRKLKISAKLYGIVHLAEGHLLELYGSDDYVKAGLNHLDKVIVLGSSLQDYFIRLGFEEKVICTYHYVDSTYYKPMVTKTVNNPIRVITMGSLKRNHADLRDIIAASPAVHFDVCMGGAKLESVFSGLKNVTLYGFLDEEELLKLMQQADLSISVLDDTIGSNVITTSLACGLPQIVSNVGSIKDYCDDTNSILCNNIDDFVEGVEKLRNNKKLRMNMSLSARTQAEKLDIKEFNKCFNETIIGDYGI